MLGTRAEEVRALPHKRELLSLGQPHQEARRVVLYRAVRQQVRVRVQHQRQTLNTVISPAVFLPMLLYFIVQT